MKTFALIAVVAFLALNVLLFVNQRRLEQRIESLQTSNAQLTQQVGETSARFSSEAVRDAETRLAHAEQFMDAVENRLTNATVLLGTIQSAAQRSANVPNSTGRSMNPNGRNIPGAPITSPGDPLAFNESELQPSSSHTPDGQLQQRSWGPEQLLGPPNTHTAGDISTAWAPRDSTGKGEEWLHLGYDQSVEVAEVRVRETYNPGAVSKIAASMPDGREVILWEGTEPKAEAPVDMSFTVPQGVNANSIKVYLDRTRVPGWNEIDAVELVGRDGSRQWATSAKTSSSYAEPRSPRLSSSLILEELRSH